MVPAILSATDFFVILDHFLPFYTPNKLKNQNFEKLKKTPEYIIILHMHTINDNQMMYGSCDIECDRQIFLSFQTIFRPFTPITSQNIKIFWTIFCTFILLTAHEK